MSNKIYPRHGDRAAIFQFWWRISSNLTISQPTIFIDLAAREEAESADRSARLTAFKRINDQRHQTSQLPVQQQIPRLEFQRQKKRNRKNVNRWRTRNSCHYTVHCLDRNARIRSHEIALAQKMNQEVSEILVMKANFESKLLQHNETMLSSCGKDRLLIDSTIKAYENRLARIPEFMKNVGTSRQQNPIQDSHQTMRPDSDEAVVRETVKVLSLSTMKMPIIVTSNQHMTFVTSSHEKTAKKKLRM